MCLQFADQTLSFQKGILKNLCVRVGTMYAPADFVVIETGNDERAPIILGRPFLNTSGAVIYASTTKISFYIKGGRRHFPSRTRLHKFQINPDVNQERGPTGGTGTSKCGPSQLRWSLQFMEVKITNLSHHFRPRRMTQECQTSIAPQMDTILLQDDLRHRIRRQHNGRSHLSALVRNHALKTNIHSTPDGRSDILRS